MKKNNLTLIILLFCISIFARPISLSDATISSGTYTTTAPSYNFDGSDDYIDLGADKPTDLTGDITISAWINPEGWGENNQGRIIDNGKLLMFIVSDGRVFLYSNASLSTASQTSSISLNTWQHVLITRNSAGDETNFYIDGVLSGTANQNSGTPSNIDLTNTFIGNREAGDKTFDGQISGLKIWNRILSDGSGGTENEIEYLYNKERGKY